MAIYDREERKLVVRVVYDGPASVGKTTNLKQLCEFFTTRRRSELFVPEELGGRTLFFDWLQIEAGFVGGHPLRCHFVTVPGQAVLNHRRQHLLASADAVVFVCESSEKGVKTAREVLDSLVNVLQASDVPLIVQANKQDLPGAVASEELGALLGVNADVPVVPARADQGVGVRETVVLAIRAAANRVQRELLEDGLEALGGTVESGKELHEALLAADELIDLSPVQTLLARAETVEEEGPLETTNAVALSRPTDPPHDREPPLPDPSVRSGHIWPTPDGRNILRTALQETLRRRDDLVAQPGTHDGSGKSDVLIYEAGSSWCLKTSRRRCFSTDTEARTAIRDLVQAKLRLGTMLPPMTVLALKQDAGLQFWLWTVTPWLTTLRTRMARAEEKGDERVLGEALELFAHAAVESMVLSAREGVCLDVHPSNFANSGENLWYLDDDITSGNQIPTIGYALLHRVEEYAHRPEVVDRYLTALEDKISARLSKEEVGQLDLGDAIEQSIVRSGETKVARSRLSAVVSRCRSYVSQVR